MAAPSLATLLIRSTKAAFYELGLSIAAAVGLPVTSWHAGDPTRSLFHLESEIFDKLEGLVHGFIGAGFLDYADPEFWLSFLAKQVFNVDVPAATFATTSVVLTNAGGGSFTFDPNSLTFRSAVSQKTYHNTTGGTLVPGPGTTLTLTIEADEAGSGSSAGAGEISEMVTSFDGVTCTNPTAALGLDKQAPATTIKQCRDKLGIFSPNGPAEAYSYVARESSLTGTTAVSDARVYADSETGDVTVYIRSGSGTVTEPDRLLVEAAILKWATPLCITPTVLSAAPVTVAVTYQLWIYVSVGKTGAQVKTDIETALKALFASIPIGGDIIPPATTGTLYKRLIESTILGVFDQGFLVTVTAPSSDTALTAGQVAVLGTVTGTITFVKDP